VVAEDRDNAIYHTVCNNEPLQKEDRGKDYPKIPASRSVTAPVIPITTLRIISLLRFRSRVRRLAE
jgi:hypothetical protein